MKLVTTPRIDDRHFGYRMRLGEGGLCRRLVADRHVEQHIAGMLRPDLRCAGFTAFGDTHHSRQRRPLDLDRLDGIARLIDGLGHDEGHGIPDMAHFSIGQDRIGRPGKGIVFQVEQARQVAELFHVLGGQDQTDARQAAGTAGIDGEGRVRMRRAQHQRLHRSRWGVIIGVTAPLPRISASSSLRRTL